MILQTSFWQVFIDQEPVIPIKTVSYQLDQIRVMKLTEILNLRLQPNRQWYYYIYGNYTIKGRKDGLMENKEWDPHQPLLVALKALWL